MAICIIDQDGKVRLERSVPSDVPDLVHCLHEFGEPIHQVGLEAGTLTQHLTYGLKEAGLDVVCMEARQVNAALSAMRNKTDKHGARGIAQILRSCISMCLTLFTCIYHAKKYIFNKHHGSLEF